MVEPLQDYMRELTVDERELLDATLERAYGLADTNEEKRNLFELSANVIRFYVKFDSMSDRLRWRKQSEEPAPHGTLVLRSYQYATGGYSIDATDSGCVDAQDEWRPL